MPDPAAPTPISPHVRWTRDDAVLTVTLARPEARNALTREMREELDRVLAWCEGEGSVRVVVLAGDGPAFCAGQDLKESAGPAGPAESVEAKLRGDFQTRLASLPQVTIAALHGAVVGRGLEIALTCDIRVAGDDATFALPEVGLGMIPASGGTQRLPRLVAPARALDIILSGERVDASTALSWGLVTRLVPLAELAPTVRELARRIATHAPIALRYAKRAVLEGEHLALSEGLHLEATLAALLRTTDDRAEGIRAFREKRPPRFTGR
ncbi:MAG: enoyl-CoA hydratase/isomerase family protein [Chloroflexota bacterium]|nr:enoyl-CoA hydratase/isomerase family protein [Chloroflexota bacterium]